MSDKKNNLLLIAHTEYTKNVIFFVLLQCSWLHLHRQCLNLLHTDS